MLFVEILAIVTLVLFIAGIVLRKKHQKGASWLVFLTAAVMFLIAWVLGTWVQTADTRPEVTKFVQDQGYTLDGSPTKVDSCKPGDYAFTSNAWTVDVTDAKGAHRTLCVSKAVGGYWAVRGTVKDQ